MVEQIKSDSNTQFVWDNQQLFVLMFQVLAAMSNHGVVYFVNILSCKMLFTIGNREHMIDNFTISNNGWYMACGMENGRMNVYR